MEKNSEFVPGVPLNTLKLLTKRKAPFIIVGGAAMALHGIPRSTLDIDIVIPALDDILSRLFSAAGQAGLFSKQDGILNVKSNLLIGQWITFQDSAGRELFDVLIENKKHFDRLLKKAVKRKGDGFIFYIAGLDDIKKMKKASGRPIDLADIVLIQERQNFRK